MVIHTSAFLYDVAERFKLLLVYGMISCVSLQTGEMSLTIKAQVSLAFSHDPNFHCMFSIAWDRVSVQASLPERRKGKGQEGPGEVHRAQSPPHLLTVSA